MIEHWHPKLMLAPNRTSATDGSRIIDLPDDPPPICWMRLRTTPEFARYMPPTPPPTTRAWDVMRLSAVAGRAVEAGWMTGERYMDHARRGVEILRENYSSWRQAANGFTWGRAMWMADEVKDPATELCQFSPIFASLLTDPQSPG